MTEANSEVAYRDTIIFPLILTDLDGFVKEQLENTQIVDPYKSLNSAKID